MTTSPESPFVVPPDDEGELVDDGPDPSTDSAEADRRASYGEETTSTDGPDGAEDSAEADRRASLPDND
jgi:hypothetical protein